jgi:hypothetical protein
VTATADALDGSEGPATGPGLTIEPAPAPQELIAITVAMEVIADRLRAQPAAADDHDILNAWVEASRRSAQRSTLQRGPWRLSGRIARRSRV